MSWVTPFNQLWLERDVEHIRAGIRTSHPYPLEEMEEVVLGMGFMEARHSRYEFPQDKLDTACTLVGGVFTTVKIFYSAGVEAFEATGATFVSGTFSTVKRYQDAGVEAFEATGATFLAGALRQVKVYTEVSPPDAATVTATLIGGVHG